MKVGRNDPCPCGSGKKYKKCCLNKEKQPEDLFYLRVSDAYDKMVDQLLDFSEKTLGPEALSVAFVEFLFWSELSDLREALQDHAPVFIPWFLFDWVYDPDDYVPELDITPYQTVARIYTMSGEELDSLGKKLIEAIEKKAFSFFEVISSNAGTGFRLRDILSGEEVYIPEKAGSEGTKPGDILFARVIKVDHVHIMIGCAPFIIPPRLKPAVIRLRQDIRRHRKTISPDVLLEYQEEIRNLYLDIQEFLYTPPKLYNTDGEPVLFHTIHYEIDDPHDAFDALQDLCPGVDREKLLDSATLDSTGRVLKAEFDWMRPDHSFSDTLEGTILGNITIDRRSMTVLVNSEARAETIKQEIEARLGPRARHKGTEIESPDAMMQKEKSRPDNLYSDRDDELINLPEVREQLRQMVLSRWESWVNEKIPALGGKTPREAAKTPGGRESVEALLLDAERSTGRDEEMGEFQREGIENVRKKLKLGKWRKNRDEQEKH